MSQVINPATETLIIGTFNPAAASNPAETFYGRGRNFMWRLLPTAYGESNLKDASVEMKISFITRCKIAFIDLISEIEVEEGQEVNYSDHYLDTRPIIWTHVIEVIDNLPDLKRVCFSRRTFSGIPNMAQRVNEIALHCKKKGLHFQLLTTPARFYSEAKQIEWSNFLRDGAR